MWAVKGHYFTPVLQLALHVRPALRRRALPALPDDPDRFRAGYDDLLSSTGLADAADLAARFGIDVRSDGFWTSSLDVIRDRIDQFVALTSPNAP